MRKTPAEKRDGDQLFRHEVFAARREVWLGDIILSRQLSWAALATCFLVGAIALIAFATWGTYTRKIRASGYLVPDIGVLKVASPQLGVVSKLFVAEAQHVDAGETVAVLNSERTTASGDASAGIQKQMLLRLSSLREQREKINELYDGQHQAVDARLKNLRTELSQIDTALQLQKSRIGLTERMLANQRQLKARGVMSDMALQQKEQDHMGDQSTLVDIQRDQTALLREVGTAEAEKKALSAKRANELSAVDRDLASLEQDRIESESQTEIFIRAPQAGIVTAIMTDTGKQALAGQPLLNLIPDGAQLQAEVYLPSRAAGFVHVGTKAQLQFQAFPYQKFGSYSAQVIKLSRVALASSDLSYPAPAGSAPGDLFYVASLKLNQTTVLAYGKQEPLQAGMGFDANLVLDRRTLLEWVFEPLYSISGNMVH